MGSQLASRCVPQLCGQQFRIQVEHPPCLPAACTHLVFSFSFRFPLPPLPFPSLAILKFHIEM
jgi:hypothetical protein